MLDINSINGTTETGPKLYTEKELNETTRDDFFNLLIAQVTHQDPTAPMEDKEFIAQMAQFNALEEMKQLNNNFGALLASQNVSQASNLIGNYVTALDATDGSAIAGLVTKVQVNDNNPLLILDNGAETTLNNLIEVSPPIIYG